MKRTRRLKWLALAVAMVLVPAAAMPLVQAASADATLAETEVVVAQLSESGAVSQVAIDDFLRLQGSGTMRVTKKADLSDVSAQFDSPKPSVSDSTLTWNEDVKGPGKPTDIYFTGQADLLSGSGVVKTPRGDKQLPVRVKTTYSLNGTEVTDLEKIKGKAGTFELELVVDNITGQAREVTYTDSVSDKEVTDVGFVFIPLTVSVGPLFFDDENWKGLEAENGQLGHRGDGATVTASGVLFPPTQPGSLTLKVKGQTKSFDLPSGRIVVTPGIGMEQAEAVADAQELGGGATDTLLYALNQFYGAFLQLTSPEEGLPKAADGLKQIAEEGLDVLSRSLEEGGRAVNTQLVPNMKTLYDGLVELRTQIEGTLAPGLAQLAGALGKSNYTNPLCSSAGNTPPGPGANCTFASSAGVPKQLGEVPPMVAKRTTTGWAASLDTRNNTYRSQEITRTTGGQLGGDLTQNTLPDGSGGYFGSLYNWAAMIKFAAKGAIDADNDGVADFDPFVFPNPDTYPGYYTTAALNTIAMVKGELYPGVSGGPPPLLKGLCDDISPACPAFLPTSDITLRSLLNGTAKSFLPELDLSALAGGLLGPNAKLNLGTVLLSGSEQGINNAIDSPVTATVDAGGLGIITDSRMSRRGWSGASQNYASLLGPNYPANGIPDGLKAILVLAGGLSPDAPKGTDTAPSCWPTLNQVLTDLTILTAPPGTVATQITCAQAFAGPLGAIEASATVIESLLWGPGFNFTASVAGYPGYQVTDLGNAQTGPKISQAVNLINYSVDREDALCPSSMPKDGAGNYIVPIVPPVLDTPCDKVLADPGSRTVKPQTAEKALSIIAGGYGNPRVTRLDRRGQPDDIATAVRALGKALQFTAPAAIGTWDPSDLGVTIEGSIAYVAESLSSAATQLGAAVSASPLLIGGVSGVQISGDFNTALSQEGLKRAKKYTTFMGLAESGGEEADGSVMFVFELPGVKV